MKYLKYELTGQKFHRLKVISYNHLQGKWYCRCDCGNRVYYKSQQLRTGAVKSCGCVRIEMAIERNVRRGGR